MSLANRFLERNTQAMKCNYRSFFRNLCICFGLALFCVSAPAQKVKPSGPINLDRALEEQVAPDRVASYYHYSLSKWFDNDGETSKALSEMQTALRYNPGSATVHVEMARLLEKTGNAPEAIVHAQEAIGLDPQDPDPHWFLIDYYFRAQERGGDPKGGMLQKAVEELEKLRVLSPTDERIYYDLGGAYFQLNQPQKAIEAYEKYQSVSTNSDSGYREIAKYYVQNGDENKAIEYLNKGLVAEPDSPESLMMLGSVYLKLNKSKEAVAVYKRLLEATGNNIAVSRQLAASLYDAGEYKDAIVILKNLISAAPTEKTYQILLGRAQIGLRDYPEAIKTLKAVDPRSSEAQFWLGVAYEESGKYTEAVEIFSRLLSNVPATSEELRTDRIRYQQRLAENYFKLREYDKAIAAYQELAKTKPQLNLRILDMYRISRQFTKAIPFGKQLYDKDPGDAQLAMVYSQTLADAGRPKEGIEILSKIYEKDHTDVPIAVAYARILAEGGRSKEAVDILSGLIKDDPENVDLYLNLSRVYAQDKRFSEAEGILRTAEGKSTDNETTEELQFRRVLLYEKQKDFARAESLSKEILNTNPNNAPVLNYVGYMLADRGVRLDEAVRYVKEALAIDPDNGAYLDSLGWAFFKLNDMEKAEKYLLEADNNEKNDPTIKEHLGDLYFKTGNLLKAQDFWTRSVRLGTDTGTEQEDLQKVRQKLEALQETLRKQKPKK
jgi:tetratricopeptide (TPR) repeat protein